MVVQKEYLIKDIFPNIILTIELEIDPNNIDAQDDRYTLICSDDISVYSKTLTLRDDHEQGDEFLTLKFMDLVEGHNYTLKIDPGKDEEPYAIFEDVPLENLAEYLTYESEAPLTDDEEEDITDDIEILDEEYDDDYEWSLENYEPIPTFMEEDSDQETFEDEEESSM